MKAFEIIGNGRYVDPSKQQGNPWYVLCVINQWDFTTKVVCRKNGINFCLKKNTPTGEKDSWVSELVKVLSEEMRRTLIEDGYSLSGSTEQWHLSVIDAMCTETLNPELGAKWEEIKADLILLRKNL